MKLRRKDILGLRDFGRDEIELVLETAVGMKEILSRRVKKVPTLRGRAMITLFYENSTRTRTSFEMAAKIMSAEAINIAVAQSSAAKGESLKDTVQTLRALSADCIVMRHGNSGAPHFAAERLDIPVINAGDGFHEHPSQGLLDLFTIQQAKGSFEGLNVTIVGDLLHSRVARSATWGLLTMGANVTLCGPRTLLPPEFAQTGARLETDADEAVKDADVVMMLRLQQERMDGVFLPGVREYAALYGLNSKRLAKAKPGALVMHPGPMNRGVEISDEVADGAQSAILEQVNNGVATRMALLYLVMGGSEE
jgi:aspartate carbamoyltransferase catalytic subunit